MSTHWINVLIVLNDLVDEQLATAGHFSDALHSIEALFHSAPKPPPKKERLSRRKSRRFTTANWMPSEAYEVKEQVDVVSRQMALELAQVADASSSTQAAKDFVVLFERALGQTLRGLFSWAVSYTHLTLPTICSV